MNMLNSLIVEGTITEFNFKNPNGLATTDVTICTTRNYKDMDGKEKEEVNYFEIKAFGNMATIVNNNAKVGKNIRVVGRLKQERYEANGHQFSKLIIIAEHFEFRK